MDARSTRTGVIAVIVVTVLALGAARVTRSPGAVKMIGPPDTVHISEKTRAAPSWFAAGVAPSDRAWIEAAMASARPEAQALIGVVDGMVEWRTVPGGDPYRDPLGVTMPALHPDGTASFVIELNIGQLDGRRVQDRSAVVLHELGHVVDIAIVPKELDDRLDAMIPRTGACSESGGVSRGSCTEPMERFADTFAKWALHGAVSVNGAGYGVATPASLEDWGAPLADLAIEIQVAAAE